MMAQMQRRHREDRQRRHPHCAPPSALAPLVQRLEIEDHRAGERARAELNPPPPVGRLEMKEGQAWRYYQPPPSTYQPRLRFEKVEGPPIVINGVEIRPIGRVGVDEEMQRSKAYQEQQKVRRQTEAGYAVYNALLPDSLTAAIQAVSAASLAVSDSDSLFHDALSLANAPPE
jgi:hypothetical protein